MVGGGGVMGVGGGGGQAVEGCKEVVGVQWSRWWWSRGCWGLEGGDLGDGYLDGGGGPVGGWGGGSTGW